jgi:hypothetical protein
VALVHIDNLAPGMVLKKDVTDRSGKLLLPEGAVLTEKHFVIFRMWGVLELEITGAEESGLVPVPQGEEIDPDLLAQASDEVLRIFAHNDPEHPAIRQLIIACIKRRAAHAA